MEIFQARSMKSLLWKVAISVFLLCLLIEPIVRAADRLHGVDSWSYSVYRLIAELVGLVLAIFWGLYFRRANAALLSTQVEKREKYARGVLLLLLFVGITILFPELLAYYNSVLSFIGRDTENVVLLMLIERLYATATRLMILFSLGAVFFCRGAFKKPRVKISWEA